MSDERPTCSTGELLAEGLAAELHAQLPDAWAPCTHALVVDDILRPIGTLPFEAPIVWRRCLLCGVAYERSEHTGRLREAIRERHRLPKSPWTSEELAEEADL